MKPSDDIFVVPSPLGYLVVCTGKQLKEHIIETSSHNEMEDPHNIEAMKAAITDPEIIYESCDNPDRDLYFGKSTVASCGLKGYTEVVVEIPDKNIPAGDVITSFHTQSIPARIQKGVVKYERDKKN